MRRVQMTRFMVAAVAAAGMVSAQNLQEVVKRGEDIFSKTCATGYCHAAKGATAGGGPRLAARGFTQAYIGGVVAQGVPGTSMPGFAGSLSAAERVAVVAYVATLNGIENPNITGGQATPGAATPALSAQALSAQATRGRQLFSDAVRGFGRCSTCHEVRGIGIPVAPPIGAMPADAAAAQAIASPNVATVTLEGETMPALVVARKAQSVAFYDLTAAPPVLHTALPSAVQVRDGSSWKHSAFTGSYGAAELADILAYLRAAQR